MFDEMNNSELRSELAATRAAALAASREAAKCLASGLEARGLWAYVARLEEELKRRGQG